ncbi:MAG: 2,5-diketo-D-gluconic acid reductase A [Chlamydiia bacterium]|nr:2,5-diketo-D-gluconic acid reductase A [Chlamydiia bacterium]
MQPSSINPPIGYGTYRQKGVLCADNVKRAIDCGYRVIDTATLYENMDAVGKGIQGYERGALYIISKVWPNLHTREGIQRDLEQTLDQLQSDYLDAYLLHWPDSKARITPIIETMKEAIKAGRLRHFGVSNVNVNHLKRLLEFDIPITWVQNEIHPNYINKELVAFCKAHEIGLQAWRPLAHGEIIEDKELLQIGKRYGKTPAQVALRWAVQLGVIPLPGSKTAERIKENFTIFDFALSAEEMALITNRAEQGIPYRLSDPDRYGFTDEFDFSYEECWPHL